MVIQLQTQAFNPWQAMAEYQPHTAEGSAGACALFVGTMRADNLGDAVTGLFIEHYPGMTERELHHIAQEAQARWPILDMLIVHRVGEITVGEAIVLAAIWSAHRGAALDACGYVVEQLKSRAPFWKKETLTTGERWVEHNTAR